MAAVASSVLDDLPVDEYQAQKDVRFAQRAVIVHGPEDWPSGRQCRNDGTRFPCRLHVWGFRVLLAAGWTPPDVAELVRKAESGEVPWA